MLTTFSTNVSDGIASLKKNVNKKNWQEVGQIAHRLMPSYIHLSVHKAIPILQKIEKTTLHQNKSEGVPGMVGKLISHSELVLNHLKREIETLQNQQ